MEGGTSWCCDHNLCDRRSTNGVDYGVRECLSRRRSRHHNFGDWCAIDILDNSEGNWLGWRSSGCSDKYLGDRSTSYVSHPGECDGLANDGWHDKVAYRGSDTTNGLHPINGDRGCWGNHHFIRHPKASNLCHPCLDWAEDLGLDLVGWNNKYDRCISLHKGECCSLIHIDANLGDRVFRPVDGRGWVLSSLIVCYGDGSQGGNNDGWEDRGDRGLDRLHPRALNWHLSQRGKGSRCSERHGRILRLLALGRVRLFGPHGG